MLVNTRLIILVSVLQLLLFPPRCHGHVGLPASSRRSLDVSECLRPTPHAQPLPHDRFMLSTLGSRGITMSAALPQLGSVGLAPSQVGKILACECALQWVQLTYKLSWYC